jgi:hypothetical protein
VIRKHVKHFAEFPQAAEFKASLEGNHQIRRRRNGFDVVERIEGKSETKINPNKRRKGKKRVAFEF